MNEVRSEWEALLMDYCRRIDARDFSGLGEVFIPECRVSYGTVDLEGIAAVEGFVAKAFTRFADTRHVLGEVERIRPGEKEVWTRAGIEAWHQFHPRDDGTQRPDLTLFGRFESRLISTPEGWRIAEHRGSENGRKEGD